MPVPTVSASALPAPHPSPEDDCLTIPVREFSADDTACRVAREQGQFLARQDRWEDLSEAIRSADAGRESTPGGMPVAELIAFGARSDVVLAVEHALQDGCPAGDAPLIDGITELEAMRADYLRDPYISLIVALAHIDIGWAWRGAGWRNAVPQINRERCAAHFDRAADLLSPFDGVGMDSPIIAAAQCTLLAGRSNGKLRIADEYEKLIDLDPNNHRPMRAMGIHLLPRQFGSYPELELEARRTAARTQAIWGAGAYTWVCLDAIALDDQACALVDVEFFVDGLRDIAAVRPEQEMINLLAAYCAVTLRGGPGRSSAADPQRREIADCAGWLIRDHLTELHPMIWAHAAEGFDNNARVTSPRRFAARGRADALRAIGEQFRDEIDRGLNITFTSGVPEPEGA